MKKTEYVKVGSRCKKKISNIDLRHNKDSFAIEYVKQQIEKFPNFVSYFPTVQIVFLEIPCYSTEHYNKHLRCPNPESFHENNLILTERIGIKSGM